MEEQIREMSEQAENENTAENDVNTEIDNKADNAENQETAETPNEEKGSIFQDIMDIAESVVISVLTVLLIFSFVARPVTVDGSSMVPTLENQDQLVMNMFFYTPKQGDIVVVANDYAYYYENRASGVLVQNEGLKKRLIKRVIATEGQTVDIDFNSNIVTVDGQQLYEEYINEPTALDTGAFDYPVTVPEGFVFVMGDNRNNSTDSRSPRVGFVKEEDVIGKAIFRFWPFEKISGLY